MDIRRKCISRDILRLGVIFAALRTSVCASPSVHLSTTWPFGCVNFLCNLTPLPSKTAACAFLRGSSGAARQWWRPQLTDAKVVSVAQKANRGRLLSPLLRCSATANKPRTRRGHECWVSIAPRGGCCGNRLPRPEEDGLPGAAASPAGQVRLRYQASRNKRALTVVRHRIVHSSCLLPRHMQKRD